MALEAVPAGVLIPPTDGPQAQAIISALPKLLRKGSTPSARRTPTASGSRMAATAPSDIPAASTAPAVKNAKMIPRGLRPTRRSSRPASRAPRPVLVTARDNRKTPITKAVTGCPKPFASVWLKS